MLSCALINLNFIQKLDKFISYKVVCVLRNAKFGFQVQAAGKARLSNQQTTAGASVLSIRNSFRLSKAVIPGRHLVGLESPTYSKGKFSKESKKIH